MCSWVLVPWVLPFRKMFSNNTDRDKINVLMCIAIFNLTIITKSLAEYLKGGMIGLGSLFQSLHDRGSMTKHRKSVWWPLQTGGSESRRKGCRCHPHLGSAFE